jgi:acyl-CoA synthetase (AMP-forming)/AMP-acid ligase II/acyl carrier protein
LHHIGKVSLFVFFLDMTENNQIVSGSLPPRRTAGPLAQLLNATIRSHSDKTAVLAPGYAPLTYGSLGRQLEATARALADAGYGRRSRIGIALPEGPEFAVAVLAVTCAATCVPLNQRLEQGELVKLLTAMRVEALIVAEGADSPAVAAARRAEVALLRLRSEPNAGAGGFLLLAEHQRESVLLDVPASDDVAIVGHTSGTTATPKIVPYEQWRLAQAARNRVDRGELSANDRIMLLTPLYSLGTIRRSLLPPLLVGGSIVCPVALEAKALVDVLEDFAPTQCLASPAMLMALLDEFERRSPRPQHSLRLIYSSYSELPADVQVRLQSVFGVPVVRTYGMTETGNIAQTPLSPVQAPAGSVGRAGIAEIAIADATGRFLGSDENGEILVRGPEVFSGYENDDEANRNAFRAGWFRTGDLGRVDRDGFVYLEGRLKDVINRGGAKISPREVEDVLGRHPGVREAAVFPVPHPTLGEAVAAAVVLRRPASVSPSELRRHAREQLAAFKVPSRVIEVDYLPRGPLGKVNRTELAKMAEVRGSERLVPPQPGEEAEIARIFAEVLEVPVVGRQDSFFDLGGDSLRGVRVVVRVEETFGVAVTLDLLYDHPTVAAFAGEIIDLVHRARCSA